MIESVHIAMSQAIVTSTDLTMRSGNIENEGSVLIKENSSSSHYSVWDDDWSN